MENYAVDSFSFNCLIVIVVFHTVTGLLPTVIQIVCTVPVNNLFNQ